MDIKSQPDFNDFTGVMGSPDYYNQGLKYFTKLFTDVNENPDGRMIYTHAVCATDTSNVQIVMNSCKDIILRGNMADSGFAWNIVNPILCRFYTATIAQRSEV